MTKKEIIKYCKDYIQYAYNNSDDYVNWTWIESLKQIIKKLEEEGD